MPLPEQWASGEDFATLFQYIWYRDFPIGGGPRAVGALRSDWTIHTGLVVRSIADFIGLWARFESGQRTDAVLRSGEGDEVAVEWEWDGVWGQNELQKLKNYKVWSRNKGSKRLLRYAVLITYTHTPNIEKVKEHVLAEWQGAPWPLLLILIDVEESNKFTSGKEFKELNMSLFDTVGQKNLRTAPAFPWSVESSRWRVLSPEY